MKALNPMLLGLVLWTATNWGFAATGASPQTDLEQQVAKASKLFAEGHPVEALKIYESLLPALQSRTPSPQLGSVLNAMSKIAAADGKYDDASRLAKESADVYRQIGDASGESHALNNKAIAELQNGAYPTARQDLEQALGLARTSRDLENEVQVLNNLGSSYYFPGSYSEALQRYDEAMNLVNRSAQEKWSDYWRQITNFNRATLFQRLGRYERTLQIYRQVEASSKTLTAGDRAHLYANLGTLYRRLGDPYKALDAYRLAQQLYSEQHDADGEIAVFKNIGIVYALDMEDLNRAQTIFRNALTLAQKTRNRREEMQAHLYLGETLFRSHSLLAAHNEFNRSRDLANELNTLEEQWKSLYGLGSIADLSGDPAGAEADYRQAISIIEKTRSQLQLSALRAEFFADKRDAYDALIGLLLRKGDVPEAFLFLERSRARSFQDRFQQQNRESAPKPLTLDQAQSALDPATVLLEFWTAREQIGLIWCTRQTSGMMLRRVSAPEHTSIHKLLDGLPHGLNHNWREQMSVLDHLLPDGTPLPPGMRHLLVVPDGWISYVPFDLLHAERDSNSLLIERYDISYLPTAAFLRRPQTLDRRTQLPWTHELVAFGDPRFKSEDSQVAEEDLEKGDPQQLRYSADEIAGIGNRNLALDGL
ncbi:MAG: tetratricopeptide repeat protein [Acidobacteriia bacterium]|nr:tetratricopeptide repeat protein [Terriglobia bacterium]